MSDQYEDSSGKPIPSLIINPSKYTGYETSEGHPLEDLLQQERKPPLVGRAAAASLPMIGGVLGSPFGLLGAGAGAGIGSGTSELLKQGFPRVFGKPSENPNLDIPLDALTQGVIPEGVGQAAGAGFNLLRGGTAGAIASKLFRYFPATKEGVSKSLTADALGRYQFPESGILESAASKAKGSSDELTQKVIDAFNAHPESMEVTDTKFYHPDVKAAIAAKDAAFSKNSVGDALVNLQKEYEAGTDVAGSQTYKSIAKTALSDIRHVRNWKIATGEPETIKQLALNDLVTNGFKESTGKINAGAILDKLNGPQKEIYAEAIPVGTLKKFQEAMTLLKSQEKSGLMDKVVNWSNGHLMWTIPAALSGLEGGSLGGIIGTGGIAATSMTLTNRWLAKAMSNPVTADAVVQAMKTPANSPQAMFWHQIIANSMRGAETAATMPDK